MIKVAFINLGLYGSTGRIVCEICDVLKNNGHKGYLIYPDYPQNLSSDYENFKIRGRLNRKINAALEKTTGYQGGFSYKNTRRVIKYLKTIKPDIIHLHNIHGMKINYKMLFDFLKESQIPTVWTLHDCWSFTGKCPHFTYIKCDRWKTGCYNCSQYKEYPQCYIDNTRIMWRLKKKWFNCVDNMTLVTPSCWLADLVKQSFLKDYPLQIINNGIDLSIFKPTESNFRKKYNIEDKLIVLGVAFDWGIKKGLDVFVDLSKLLDERYQVILVGTTDHIDEQLPDNIISIHRTQNQIELAEIYSAADVFVNPTREEVLGLVNIEALACGTPVVTFCTGGCPECIDETCGVVVGVNDIDEIQNEIKRICTRKPYSLEACLKKSLEFDKNARFNDYLELYKAVLKGDTLTDEKNRNDIK